MSDAQFVGVLNVKFYAQLSLALVYLVERRDNNQFRYLSNSLPPSSQYVRYTKFGTHLATNCSNPSGRGDTSHREIASSKNFCENPCLRSKSQKSNQIELERRVAMTNFVAESRICRDLSPQRIAQLVAQTCRPTCTQGVICRRDMLQRRVV